MQIIWTFFELIGIYFVSFGVWRDCEFANMVQFLPETDVPVLLMWKAERFVPTSLRPCAADSEPVCATRAETPTIMPLWIGAI